jgi:superfamily II DNA/RNA helicase
MLDMGFIPDIERICEMIPFTRQTLFFSATMPPEITKLTEKFLQAPVRVEVSKPASTATTVTQRLVKSGSKSWDKRAVLRKLIEDEGDALTNAIIFCNRKVDVSELFRSLTKHDFDAGALHGDMDQRARMATLDGFRNNKLRLLVASDVAARGLDIPAVSHVFNFDVPIHAEDYVHRIGRTGRAGRSGKAFTIVTRNDTKYLDAVEKLIGQSIEWLDGDVSTLSAEPEGEDAPRRGRGRGAPERSGGGRRERAGGGRDRGRGRDRERDRADVVTAEAAEAPVVADVPAEDLEAIAMPERLDRRDAIRAGNESRRGGQPQPPQRRDARNDRGSRYRDREEVNTIVGFGDDVPAFMKVVAKV